MVFRINKTKDFTVMSNYHLQDPNLSLKAKGLLSILFSLPEDWNYSKNGLLGLIREGKAVLESVMKELKEQGYLKITQNRVDGKYSYEYDIYETPYTILPNTEKPYTENQYTYKILNNKILNKEIDNNKLLSTKKSKFIPPTLEEITAYCIQRNNGVDPQKIFDYYSSNDWKDSKGQPIKNWKQKIIGVWERDTKVDNTQEESKTWIDDIGGIHIG